MNGNISDAKYKTTQSVDWRPSANNPSVEKTAPVVPRIPHIINHILPTANTWYEIKMPSNIVTWQMRAREDYDLNYAYVPNPANYMTLTSGTTLSEDTVPNRSIWSIFVRCGTANVVVELEVWMYA